MNWECHPERAQGIEGYHGKLVASLKCGVDREMQTMTSSRDSATFGQIASALRASQ
jgi:hypothetical protein